LKRGRYLLSRVYISHVTRKHLGILFYSPLRRAGRRAGMKVRELEEFLRNVTDKNTEVFFYLHNDNPVEDSFAIENTFEISKDVKSTGNFEGVYLRGI